MDDDSGSSPKPPPPQQQVESPVPTADLWSRMRPTRMEMKDSSNRYDQVSLIRTDPGPREKS